MALACDVVQSAGLEECVAETHRRFGRLDVAITTVGWHPFSRFLDMPDRDVDYMINAELRSVIRLTRANPADHGRSEGRTPDRRWIGFRKVRNRNAAMSSACRGGVIAFTKAIALEHAADNILANVMCPGPTDTDLWRNEIGADESAKKIMTAMVRAIPPREVAALAVFLASDEASYITGQAISVSGGLTMN